MMMMVVVFVAWHHRDVRMTFGSLLPAASADSSGLRSSS